MQHKDTQQIPVTVLMPVYNGAKYIAEAIQSVLDQTFSDFELLIVDDGSTDETAEIIRTFKDARINLMQKSNGGVSDALNHGLRSARGGLIARFDADDICYRYRLQQQFDFMQQHPEYVLTGADVDYITEDGKFIFRFRNFAYDDNSIRKSILSHCPFVHSAVMYRKQAVLDAGGYEVKAHTFEDHFLWTKLVAAGKVQNVAEPLIQVRFNPQSVTIDEKDYDPVFRKLKYRALETGEISDEDGRKIKESIKRLSPEKKLCSYNRMLGKKFLWDNYKPVDARRYLSQAIRLEPFRVVSYVLFMLSFMPQSLIRLLYRIVKHKSE